MMQTTIALSVCDWLPIRPQLVTPPLALGIHLVLRGSTPGVYSAMRVTREHKDCEVKREEENR